MKQLPELVNEWLTNKSRDHWDGLSLLSQLTNNRTMIRNLTKKDSKYNREKLLNEIRKLSNDLPPITTPLHTAAGDDPGESGSQNEQQPAKENDELNAAPPADHPGGTVNLGLALSPLNPDDAKSAEELEISVSKMFNLKGILSNSLRDFKDDDNAGRKATLDRIADIKKSMEEKQARLDHFKQHGVLPALVDPPTPPPEKNSFQKPIPDDLVLLNKMLLNERSNLSKLKGKLAKGSSKPDQLVKMEQDLLAKTELVNELQRRLNGSRS